MFSLFFRFQAIAFYHLCWCSLVKRSTLCEMVIYINDSFTLKYFHFSSFSSMLTKIVHRENSQEDEEKTLKQTKKKSKLKYRSKQSGNSVKRLKIIFSRFFFLSLKHFVCYFNSLFSAPHWLFHFEVANN